MDINPNSQDLSGVLNSLTDKPDSVYLNDLVELIPLLTSSKHPRLQEFRNWKNNLSSTLKGLNSVWSNLIEGVEFQCLEEFTRAYAQMNEEVLQLISSGDEVQAEFLRSRLDAVLDRISKLSESSASALPLFAGNPLRAPQATAYKSFCEWLQLESENPKMGHAILPGGTGKTALAVLMAEHVANEHCKKTLVLTLNNTDAVHFAQEHKKHSDFCQTDRQAINLTDGGNGAGQDTRANFIISNFAGQAKWPEMSGIGLIIIDEADIHALSDKNATLLKCIAKEHQIPIVATSATAELANGSIIEDVFPDPILFMALPETLPDVLQMGLMPEADFYDVTLNAQIDLGHGHRAQQEISDEAQESLLAQNWIDKLLDFFEAEVVQDGKVPKTVFHFRNNRLLEELITKAAERGIRLARLTGEEDADACSRIRAAIQSGELDGVVGSKKVGRGMDIPELEVVIGSELTKSPQIFWQGRARSLRLDPRNKNKQARLYNCIPSKVCAGGKALDRGEGPLTHASFFAEDYFTRNPQTGRSVEAVFANHYSLRAIAQIRSNRQVLAAQEGYTKKSPNFISFVEEKAQTLRAIRQIRELTVGEVIKLIKGKKKTRRPLEPSRLAWHERLTYEEESACIKTVQENGAEKNIALQRLIRAHQPLLEAIADVFSDNPETREELVQEGIIYLIESIPKYTGGTRFIRYTTKSIVGKMYLYKHADLRPFVHTPNLLAKIKHIKTAEPPLTHPEIRNQIGIKKPEDVDYDYIISMLENLAAGTELDPSQTDDLEDTSAEPTDEQAITGIQLKHLDKGFEAVISSRQKYVLTRRYGLDGEGDHLLEEVAKEIQFSRDKVRRIEREALLRLRDLKGISEYN